MSHDCKFGNKVMRGIAIALGTWVIILIVSASLATLIVGGIK